MSIPIDPVKYITAYELLRRKGGMGKREFVATINPNVHNPDAYLATMESLGLRLSEVDQNRIYVYDDEPIHLPSQWEGEYLKHGRISDPVVKQVAGLWNMNGIS